MKLTKLQQERIEEIIKQEMRSLKEGWRSADQSSLSSHLTERNIFEAATPLEQDLSENSIYSAMEQVALDEGQATLIAFEQELFKHISSILQSHGLLASGGGYNSVAQIIEEHGETELVDAQMECAHDIATALDNYSKVVAQLVAGAFSGVE